eukprot:g1722.t1
MFMTWSKDYLKHIRFPSLDELLKARVVVSTCCTAGRLHAIGPEPGIQPGHFQFIAVDEAGQATEPETLVSLEGLIDANTLVVLAGDPQQLGPVIRSAAASKYGLGLSMLERLFQRGLYKRSAGLHTYNPRFITKLIKNYRSHPKILDVPNRLFYDGELEASADHAVTHSFIDWAHLPNAKIPVVFHGVVGKEMREGNSPSWFNPEEALLVEGYVKKVLEFARAGCGPADIGVISPYRKQVQKIKDLLQRTIKEPRARRELMVGSVEQFQGQERKVIITSMVRSEPAHLEFDKKYNLGFLNNPKRFNVMVTRAQALLVLIGNPLLANTDPVWRELLHCCIRNGCYTGFPLPEALVEKARNPEDELTAAAAQAESMLVEEMQALGLTTAEELREDEEELEEAVSTTREDVEWSDERYYRYFSPVHDATLHPLLVHDFKLYQLMFAGPEKFLVLNYNEQ